MPTLVKNKTAKVQTKKGYDYSYGYVDLAGIDRYLEEQGLAYDQQIEVVKDNEGKVVGQFIMTQRYRVKDNVLEKWGEPLRGLPYAPASSLNIQEIGSYTTYVRRYSLSLAFGLSTYDDDGQDAMPKAKAPTKPQTKGTSATQKQKEIVKNNLESEIVKNALAYYGKDVDQLTVKEASTIIARLKEENTKE